MSQHRTPIRGSSAESEISLHCKQRNRGAIRGFSADPGEHKTCEPQTSFGANCRIKDLQTNCSRARSSIIQSLKSDTSLESVGTAHRAESNRISAPSLIDDPVTPIINSVLGIQTRSWHPAAMLADTYEKKHSTTTDRKTKEESSVSIIKMQQSELK